MVEPGLDINAPPPQAARGLDVVVQRVQEHSLVVEGPPGSFLLRALVPRAVGRATGPRVLVRGRRLDVEVAEALREPRCAQQEADEAARGMVQESPQRR